MARKDREIITPGDPIEQEIIKMYLDKKGIENIKDCFNISLAEFYKVIKRNNINTRKKMQNVNTKIAIKLILSGLNDEDVVDKLGCNPLSIQKIRLRKTDIRYYTKRKIEGKPQEKRRTINRVYQKTDDSKINLHQCGWEGLAKSIVFQAVADYKNIQRTVNRTNRISRDVIADRNSLRRFADSEWCKLLTDIDLNSIFDKIEDGKI